MNSSGCFVRLVFGKCLAKNDLTKSNDTTQTVNSNHAGYPQELADEAKGIRQGKFRWRQFHELVATVWQDTKAVNFLPVVGPARETVQVTHKRRQPEGGRTVHHQIQIDCPKVASEYGKFTDYQSFEKRVWSSAGNLSWTHCGTR